ncbi:hypothetical protein NN561_019723 [Cricetulus griseus]
MRTSWSSLFAFPGPCLRQDASHLMAQTLLPGTALPFLPQEQTASASPLASPASAPRRPLLLTTGLPSPWCSPQEPCSYSGCSWREAAGPPAARTSATSASSEEPWLRTATSGREGSQRLRGAERGRTLRRGRASGLAHHWGPPQTSPPAHQESSASTPDSERAPPPERTTPPAPEAPPPEHANFKNLTNFFPVFLVATDTGSRGFAETRIPNAVSVALREGSQLERSLFYVNLVAR